MRAFGCLAILVALAAVAGEVYSFAVASRLLRAWDPVSFSSWGETVLPLLILQLGLMVVGVVVVRRAIGRLPTALMGTMMGQNNDGGRVMIQIAGGIMLILPGFFLDVIGIILLLPLIQGLFAAVGQKVMMSVLRRQMAKMFPGGMPAAGGFPGAFAKGFPGNPFPGMQPRGPLTPDERLPRGPGRVIDTTAERVDRS